MSTATFDATDMALLALIGVLTPIIFLGGIGWAYLREQRGPTKKSPVGRHAVERGSGHADSPARLERV